VRYSFLLVATLICAWAIAGLSPVARSALASQPAPPPTASHGLTESAKLAAVYDTILAARFDAAREQLVRTCPPAPLAACAALREVALWWQIQQDPGNRSLDSQLERTAASAIDAATQWTDRDPRSAEAFFYLAAAHAPLAQWRVLRGERVAAARDGKRMKDALEQSLALDPSLQDAWFGIGLYHYYADVVPAGLKLLRMLLFLPGGDRAEGMREMLRAREQGELLRGEADYQMHLLYLWYEHQPARALELLRGLDERYPSDPLFLERIAEVEHEYGSNHAASARAWQTLLDRATAGRSALPALAIARARIGLANELTERAQPARALTVIDPVIRSAPAPPYGAAALARLARGAALAAQGESAPAIEAFTAAIDAAPRDDPDDVRARARRAIAQLRSSR
jgi:tetratricopeptide (TPR) repeat protein